MKSKYFITTFYSCFVFVLSCNKEKWRDIELISPNGKQTITIITKGNERFIMNGSYSELPNSNYAKVSIEKVDRLGDEIGICWNKNGDGWELISLYSELLENKLNTTKFRIKDGIDLDSNDIPTVKKYFNKDCDLVYPRGDLIRPGNGTKIKYK
ncbi:hypothetical protein [Soonwooa purpurea]